MNYEKYAALSKSDDALEFKFNSTGPKGEICIVVQFTETSDPDIFNLGFGNLLQNGELDDIVKNGNQDRDKILATVAAAVYEFSAQYPDKLIFFSGSSPSRTRLYRMAINIHYETLMNDYEIYGVNRLDNAYLAEPFRKTVNYMGFVVKRKTIKFVI